LRSLRTFSFFIFSKNPINLPLLNPSEHKTPKVKNPRREIRGNIFGFIFFPHAHPPDIIQYKWNSYQPSSVRPFNRPAGTKAFHTDFKDPQEYTPRLKSKGFLCVTLWEFPKGLQQVFEASSGGLRAFALNTAPLPGDKEAEAPSSYSIRQNYRKRNLIHKFKV